MEEIRKPAVSGQFYTSDPDALEKLIKKCFLDERGPGEIPEITAGDKKVLGLVVPHAGYIYSGAIAAHSYYLLAKNGFAKNFIILGPNHTGYGSGVSTINEGKWLTPLGEIPINMELARKISTGIIDIDETAHKYEHSIEVQLPFLQFLAKKEKISFVPICMSFQDYKTSQEVGEIMANAIKNTEEKTVIISSSDFSHIGFNYMTMPPPGKRVDKYTKEQDKQAIKQILKMNPKDLIDIIHKKNISMCGYGPVGAMLIACKNLGARHAELLKYGTSYEVHPGNSCVGYSAIAIY